MPSSSSYAFDPTVAEIVDEAYDRCGIDPATLSARHASSARRSLNSLFSFWANEKAKMSFKSNTDTHTLASVGENSFQPDAHVIELGQVMLKRDGKETPMEAISGDDYRLIYDKTVQGRPSVYHFDKLATPTIFYWQAAENTTDIIVYEQYFRIEDILTAAETVGVPYRWLEAVQAGLAWFLSPKFAPDRVDRLEKHADRMFKAAAAGDNDSAPLRIEVEL